MLGQLAGLDYLEGCRDAGGQGIVVAEDFFAPGEQSWAEPLEERIA